MFYKILAITISTFIACTSGYMLGDNVPICWDTDINTKITTRLDECPDGLDIKFTKLIPEVVYEQQTYETVFEFTVDSSKGFNVVKQKNKNGLEVDIPHANIHSCLAKVGFCTPFVGNTPGLATHTEALYGDFSEDGFAVFSNDVSLTAESYTIIAHGRVFVNDGNTKYDVAAAYRRTILPAEKRNIVSDTVKWGMLSLSITAAVILTTTLFLTIYWRKEKVMKFSQVEFLIVILLCAIVTCIGSLTLGYFELSNDICVIRPWVTLFPLIVLFSFLFAKTYRIVKIFNNKSLKKQYHKSTAVYLHSFIISSIYGVLIICQEIFSTPRVIKEYAPRDLINYQLVCKGNNDDIWNLITTVYIMVLLIIGLLMTKKSSSITVLFNESKYVALAMQNMAFLSLIILPTAHTVKAQPGPVFILHGVGVILAVLITSCALMFPKFNIIRSKIPITTSNSNNNTAVTKYNSANINNKTSKIIKLRGGYLPNKITYEMENVLEKMSKIMTKHNKGLAFNKVAFKELIICVNSLNNKLTNIRFADDKRRSV